MVVTGTNKMLKRKMFPLMSKYHWYYWDFTHETKTCSLHYKTNRSV